MQHAEYLRPEFRGVIFGFFNRRIEFEGGRRVGRFVVSRISVVEVVDIFLFDVYGARVVAGTFFYFVVSGIAMTYIGCARIRHIVLESRFRNVD